MSASEAASEEFECRSMLHVMRRMPVISMATFIPKLKCERIFSRVVDVVSSVDDLQKINGWQDASSSSSSCNGLLISVRSGSITAMSHM